MHVAMQDRTLTFLGGLTLILLWLGFSSTWLRRLTHTGEVNYDRWTIRLFICSHAPNHDRSIDISAKVLIAFDRPWPSKGSEGGCGTFDENSNWFVLYNCVRNTKMALYITGLCLRLTFDVAHHPVTNDITSVSSTQLDMLNWIGSFM